jgi:uncharacterized protein (TIGR03066 family)
MNTLRMLAVGAIVCLVGASVRAEDKVDYKKLIVGKWEISKAEEGTVPIGTIVEFTKDGKFIVTGKKDGEDLKIEGTYTVEKNTFTFKAKIGEEERSQTIEITKISEKEMSTKNSEGKVVECKKKTD